MSACDHPATYNSLCVKCGKVVPSSKSSASLALKGGLLKLSANEAVKVQTSKSTVLRKLQQNKKLALVLDLDHTLLHAVQIDGPTPQQTSAANSDIHHLPIEEIVGGTVKHLVMKKRPHLDFFLREVEELFQMTIYTAGTKRYAEAVVKVIDPSRKYIGDRIVSRIDGQPVRPDSIDKSLEKIFLNDSSMAVIIDDREDVWKGPQGEQLLLVRPYQYFYPGSANTQAATGNSSSISEVNNAPGAGGSLAQAGSVAPVISLNEQPGKILKVASQMSVEYTEADDQLLRCLDILKEIHRKYYALESPVANNQPLVDKRSVALAIQQIKKSILSGYTITFSGIIATNELHPQSNPFWKLAESLGAQVSAELLPRTTHLLSFHTNTKKVKQCLQTRADDVWVLHPDWLIYCRWALARAEESTFLLVGIPAGKKFPNPQQDFTLIVDGEQGSPRTSRKRKASEAVSFKETDSNTSSDSVEEKEPKRVRVAISPSTLTEQSPAEKTIVVASQHDADVEEETSLSASTLLEEDDVNGESFSKILDEDEEGYRDEEGDGDCRAYWENRIADELDEDNDNEEESEGVDQGDDSYNVTYNLYSQSDVEDDRVSQSSENNKLPSFQTTPDESDDDDFADLEQMLINRSST